ncbi:MULTISPECIES: carbohydrate ABC transporter permease [Shouchella]|uniref:ABC transporter permease protein yurN n=3 Tax=Bacillaceae TaxID=186817 RepID=A0A060M0Z6_9BACI|nr:MULTISPECIES: sugar ABC transporter permease [Bacillaceae]RQW20145.1 sugar ABC transporter permease [Bacillus sp. C1-1]AIC94238.1 ABC transporter permease protein yurN [Shouchella lehensis G1]KQL57849.1 sugar ABC transporter permease [Alkalicoccobacillus plakortidis]MBG9785853.1 sugar ABC transporter permease [Shouchella lehensis]TES48320.1 sugar ABC transporter permease [Shouchella lehensis]
MKKLTWKDDLRPVPFLLAFFVAYVLFTIYPIFKGMQMSFFNWTLIEQQEFIGLTHYINVLSDPNFWEAFGNTSLFVLLSTPTMVILALGLALMANLNTRLQTFLRGSFFIPSILSVSVISFVAIFMLQPYTGVVNNLLQAVGLNAEPFWLATPSLAWVSIIAVTLWWTVGFNMILFLTALQGIPDELYEAAEVDGATRQQMFWQITLPQLLPIGRLILLLQVLASFKVFAQILLITDGGPGTTTRPIILYIYEMGFQRYDLGYAAAMSYLLFMVLLVLSVIQLRLGGKEGRML